MTFHDTDDNTAQHVPGPPTGEPVLTVMAHLRQARNLRRAVAVVAVLLTVAAGVGVTRTALADDGPASAETDEQEAFWDREGDLWRHQNVLGELNAFIDSMPGIGTSGYITSVNDAKSLSAILLWHGTANPTQQAIMNKAHQLGITVIVKPRKYSKDELDHAIEVLQQHSGTGAFKNFTIYSAAISADFDGVVVAGQHRTSATGGRVEADAALASAATKAMNIAIAIEPGDPMIPA